MKTIYKGILLFAGMLLLSMGACSDSGSLTSSISISIGIDGAPETAKVGIDELQHEITLSGPGGRQNLSISGAGTAKAYVTAGTWYIDVKAFYGKELYAEGSAIAEVRPGMNTSVIVHMIVVWSAGDTGGGGGGGGGPGPRPVVPSGGLPDIVPDAHASTWQELDDLINLPTALGGLGPGTFIIMIDVPLIAGELGSFSINIPSTSEISLVTPQSAITISRETSPVFTTAMFSVTGILHLGDQAYPQNSKLTLDGDLGIYGPASVALISIMGGTLNMYSGVTLQNNENSGNGGAVATTINGSAFNMEGGTIKNNKALSGGGVHFSLASGFAEFNMSGNAAIEGNFATDTSIGIPISGGGVHFAASSGTIEMSGSSKIANNKINGDGWNGGTARGSLTYGGGVYFSGTSLKMIGNSEISNNGVDSTSPSGNRRGGGVYIANGDFEMDLNAGSGGIIGNFAGIYDPLETGINAAHGGGVNFEGGGDFTLKGYSKINGNSVYCISAAPRGGGINFESSGTLWMEGNSEIKGNTVRGDSNPRGGGVWFNSTYGGLFSKTGGTIDGYGIGPDETKNIVKYSSGAISSGNPGHAVDIYDSPDYGMDQTVDSTPAGNFQAGSTITAPSPGGWDF